MKKRILSLVLLVLLLMPFLFISTEAAAEDVPSLFYNDEAWYKDRSAPLVMKDGKFYIPAELYGMLDYITVSIEDGDNLLITNSRTGKYVSILFGDNTAAVNGSIVENVGVFRESGMFYVDCMLVCSAVGLYEEVMMLEDGRYVLRVYDSEAGSELDELIGKYMTDKSEILGEITDPNEGKAEDEGKGRVYIISTTADGYEYLYPSKEYLDRYGLSYTLFLSAGVGRDAVLEAFLMGEYGLVWHEVTGQYASITEPLDKLNDALSLITHRKTRLTLTTGDEDRDKILESFGYDPIVPDFHVNGGTDALEMYYAILGYLNTHDYCILLLDDCWSSSKMIEYLARDTSGKFVTANLSSSGN